MQNSSPSPAGLRWCGRWIGRELPAWRILCGITLSYSFKNYYFLNWCHFPVLHCGPSQGHAIALSLWLLEAVLLLSCSWFSPGWIRCFTLLLLLPLSEPCFDGISGTLTAPSTACGWQLLEAVGKVTRTPCLSASLRFSCHTGTSTCSFCAPLHFCTPEVFSGLSSYMTRPACWFLNGSGASGLGLGTASPSY